MSDVWEVYGPYLVHEHATCPRCRRRATPNLNQSRLRDPSVRCGKDCRAMKKASPSCRGMSASGHRPRRGR